MIGFEYHANDNSLYLCIADKASSGEIIGSMSLQLSKDIDYSKTEHTMYIMHSIKSTTPGVTIDNKDKITVLATKYVDLNTTTKLSDFAVFDQSSRLTDEQKTQVLTQLSPLVSEGLTEFSNYYAKTIKKDNKYLGATYKYFYLPVIE